ncbi:nitroreductase [Amphritea opalescens]|uniref:Putative NAD(P)H nitroreductase n=1 Tax=Amphritea opalescens TaxID=2490544 RepID=A0A430KN76_9GAMM|nr:nitroreductase family protein [Amphritea opalescens]RTE64951.1 nitroreductase [Amphritea opalescens]
MDALSNLHQRVSIAALEAPGPTSQQLDNMYRAAVRAPDHGAIQPWRFLNIAGDARQKLGELYLRAMAADQSLSPEQQTKFKNMPLRAPLIIVAIASTKDHPKVPRSEQVIAASCAVQNMLLAAHAQGLGAIWRTGELAYHPVVMEGLGLQEGEEIVGYLYVGTPMRERTAPQPDIDQFVSDWG